jgi:hypothetical protein
VRDLAERIQSPITDFAVALEEPTLKVSEVFAQCPSKDHLYIIVKPSAGKSSLFLHIDSPDDVPFPIRPLQPFLTRLPGHSTSYSPLIWYVLAVIRVHVVRHFGWQTPNFSNVVVYQYRTLPLCQVSAIDICFSLTHIAPSKYISTN